MSKISENISKKSRKFGHQKSCPRRACGVDMSEASDLIRNEGPKAFWEMKKLSINY